MKASALFLWSSLACLSASHAETLQINDEAPPVQASARRGMTWGANQFPTGAGDIVVVSCHGEPKVNGGSCDAYHGDTECSARLPVLCVKVDGRPRPGSLETPENSAVVWLGARVALTDSVPGSSLHARSDGDARCKLDLGPGWRMAEHHDVARGWSYAAHGWIPSRSRFWVAINDQKANCWDQ